MKSKTTITVTTALLAAWGLAAAEPNAPTRPVYGHANLCYQQTLQAEQGARPEDLVPTEYRNVDEQRILAGVLFCPRCIQQVADLVPVVVELA